MGNSLLTCYNGRAKVVVILEDGKVEEYLRPVRVATVLQQHPKHMVVKLDTRFRLAQRWRKLTYLRPEQTLKCKRKYLVLPNQSAGGKFVDGWDLASSALESRAKRAKMRKLKGTKYASKFSSSSALALNYTEQENSRTSLLDLDSQDHVQAVTDYSTGTSHDQGVVLSIPKPRHRDYEWRPSLDSIPEVNMTSLAVYGPY